MTAAVKHFLSEVGRRGGLVNKRNLDPATARRMVRIREARRAYRRFHSLCFWSYNPELVIGRSDLEWVVSQLRKYGNRAAWEAAARLCR